MTATHAPLGATGAPGPVAPLGLTARALEVSYGRHVALTGVDLTVDPGSVVALVGESGSGKSTFAKAVMGRADITGGELVIGDGGRRPRTAVQMVYQDPYTSLNPRLRMGTVFRQLLRPSRGAAWRERAVELLEQVHLPADALDAYPGRFSGGQRQRLAIARALAVDPRMLIADEPTSALDASIRHTVVDVLGDLNERLGVTIVFISHDLSVVAGFCQQTVVLRAGRVVESGPTAQVLGR
ncbi:MAG TPA: dipeptide/oligopeptide/nickel ABC transporter ATP-binding protein, partial [Cellulomonas sp.]